MRYIDKLNEQIEVDQKALADSEGAFHEVVRAHLITLLATVCSLTGREGLTIVQ